MDKIIVNELDVARARESLLNFGSLDAKRPDAWRQFGYRTSLSFDDYRQAYERGGAAFGAVHRILDKCWQEPPRIKAPEKDEETDWEIKLKKLLKSINAWQKLRDLDRRNMIGRFAGLIYRVADGQPLREPLVRGQRLVDLVPVYEDQIKVTTWDSDPASENFGLPTMFQYRMRPPQNSDTQGRPDQWVDVHPSRVQILAEGSVGDMFDGVPLLRAGFNALTDIEKIAGGAAEGSLKNSARTLVFEFDANGNPQQLASTPGQPLPMGEEIKTALEEKGRALNRNIDSTIFMQGGKASTLQTQQSDPSPAFEVAANLFAASVQIPMTILFGAQTGRLASDQDQRDMAARCKSRQINELTPMLEQLVRRLQAAGLVEPGEFEIEWEPLDAPGDDAKATILGKMTDAAWKHFQAGGVEPLFDGNELRAVMDYEQRPNGSLPTEDDPGLTPGIESRPGPKPPAPPALRAAA